uniref:MATH domain-containing protein n=1 Tax=Fagus sylvatica TaxID=28930 RepID=A0A2N9IEI6_FAGSY
MKLEWGIDKVIPLKAFNDASNGYLVDDTCVFGAEVFVCKETSRGKGECLSLIKEATAIKSAWKIDYFSSMREESYDSNPFNAGDQTWKIRLYPKGKGIGMGRHISLYLALADPTSLPPGLKIYAEFTLRILDQIYSSHLHAKGL